MCGTGSGFPEGFAHSWVLPLPAQKQGGLSLPAVEGWMEWEVCILPCPLGCQAALSSLNAQPLASGLLMTFMS